MTKLDKLMSRFKDQPNDFTWSELNRLLTWLEFEKIEGSGSRVKFYHQDNHCLIQLHKPHPSNVLKRYMMKEVLATLIKGRIL